MVCQFLLYNKVNQLYVYMYPHISSLLHLPPTFPIPPLQVFTKHQADLPVLCGCFPLAICFTFGSVYMSMPLFQFAPAYPSPSLCPQVHSLCLRLYSCPAPTFIRTNFIFQIPYICVSIWYLFFSYFLILIIASTVASLSQYGVFVAHRVKGCLSWLKVLKKLQLVQLFEFKSCLFLNKEGNH